jgi:methylmalonyl-CoA mutase
MDTDQPKPMELDIRAEFPPPTWEQWMQAVNDTLKGVPFDKAMLTKTYEGIELKPLYRKEDTVDLHHLHTLPGQAPFVRGNSSAGYLSDGWKIAQSVSASTPAQANALLKDELNRGLNTVNLRLNAITRLGLNPYEPILKADGLCLSCLQDIMETLDGIDLSAVPLFMTSGQAALPMLAMLNARQKQKNLNINSIDGCIGFDPIGDLVTRGKLEMPLATAWQTMYQMTFWADIKAQHLRTILIDATIYANAGASAVQELAYALAIADEYIRAMLDKGMSINQVAPHMQLNLSLGSNFFMEISKVRSARLLWAELLKAYGASDEYQRVWIHGITSKFNKTQYDPYVNMLRTTTEGFAAVIGGVDSLEVLPFDTIVKTDSEFSRRIARNQQIILQEEAHFDRVIDPAGGCYYIESLTSALAEKSWSILQELVSQGGMITALKEKRIQTDLSAMAQTRIKNVDKRKDIFVGVNMFANPIETPLEDNSDGCSCWKEEVMRRSEGIRESNRKGINESLQYIREHQNNEYMVDMLTDAWLHEATLEELFVSLYNEFPDLEIQPLSPARATQQIEGLRSQIIADQQNKEKVLSIFMANVGDIVSYKPRLDFVTGFLQVGGFYVANNDGYETIPKVIEAALFSQAPAVCICAPDETYLEAVPQIVLGIKAIRPNTVFILAGYPADKVEVYRAQGIDVFVHLKADAFETLREIAAKLGVTV